MLRLLRSIYRHGFVYVDVLRALIDDVKITSKEAFGVVSSAKNEGLESIVDGGKSFVQ